MIFKKIPKQILCICSKRLDLLTLSHPPYLISQRPRAYAVFPPQFCLSIQSIPESSSKRFYSTKIYDHKDSGVDQTKIYSTTQEQKDTSFDSDNHFTDSAVYLAEDIAEIIEQKIAPSIRVDGGDINFISYDPLKQHVVVQLSGACESCAKSTITMKFMVERALKFYFPDLARVSNQVTEDTQSKGKILMYGVGETRENNDNSSHSSSKY